MCAFPNEASSHARSRAAVAKTTACHNVRSHLHQQMAISRTDPESCDNDQMRVHKANLLDLNEESRPERLI